MSEGRRSQVVLLDERRLDIIIQSRLYAGELLDIVASHFTLKEKEYFGISFIDEHGQYSWLQLDKRVLEHVLPKKSSQNAVIVFYFQVKYFVESITQLQDSSTIEAFYLQTKSLISKGDLEVDAEIIFQLAALVIQATYGDYTDEQTFKNQLKRLPVLPTCTLKEFSSISVCEQHVLDHYKALVGKNRGAAIVNYLSIVESLPSYGQHYYEIKDKAGSSCWLSLSYRGISEYDKNDRRNPRRVFLWKQLENLYFRDRKFTVEVHEARRVVHTLSSFNLYEDAIEEPVEEFDDLSNAICDPTTQVSVSRRALAPASVTVYVWYTAFPSIAKCIWSMAIAQHQFFLDRSSKKPVSRVARSLNQIASELCHSVQSLSSTSTTSNISRSNSSVSLPTIIIEGELSEESKAATIEMLSALAARRDALQEALKKKTEELKALCLKEGELIGELPPETPFQPGEVQPQIRRRIGTSFTISDKVFYKAKGKDKESVNHLELELEYEIQSKIASAAFRLANDVAARKSVRKVRKVSYQQAASKLRNIEEKLCTLKKEKESKYRENKGSSSESNLNRVGLPVSSSETLISERNTFNPTLNTLALPSTSLPHLSVSTSSSAPPSPYKCRQRHQSLQHVAATDDIYEDVVLPFDLRRNSSSYSANSDYDAVSCGGSSVASLGIPYRNRFEENLDIEGTNHYSVPNRRASQAFNDPDDLQLDRKAKDTLSHHQIDLSHRNTYVNTPLSCSFDERMSFNKSHTFPAALNDPEFDNGMLGYRNNNVPYVRCESVKPEHFNRPFTESTLHRTRSGSLHYKLNNLHISEPDLNNEHGPTRTQHSFTVPKIRNAFRSAKCPGPEYPSGVSNQSINQVVDLVQASVLLQDSKRAVSSSSLNNSTKPKTKEWIETSLDSPIVTKKRRAKVAECPPKPELVPSAQWLENGLPPVPKFQDPYQPQPGYQNSFSPMHSNSPPPELNVTSNSLKPEVVYPSSSSFPVPDQYRHYENIAELTNSLKMAAPNPPPHYENLSSPSTFPSMLTNESTTSSRGMDIAPSIAQPQEPPKHPIRRMNVGDCYPSERDFRTPTPQGLYEPVEFQEELVHRKTPTPLHCDVTDHHIVYPTESQTKEVWQSFPPSSVDKAPLSPSFPPNVEVNVVSVGHFQPYWEETKPYEISDFYKYSTKHRRTQRVAKPPLKGGLKEPACESFSSGDSQIFHSPNKGQELAASGNTDFDAADTSDRIYENSPKLPKGQHSEVDKSLSFGEMDLGISLADTFHDEMVAWYQNQDSAVKKATLV